MQPVAKYFSLFCVLLGLFLFSCKSKKYIFDLSDEQIESSSLDSILQAHNLNYEWYAAKAKFKFQADQISESGTSYIRVKKDSVVWMVLKRYSIEGFRLQMTPDSFTLIDRINKTVISLNWDEMKRWYQMDIGYQEIENLVVGNIFYDPEGNREILKDSSAYRILQQDDRFFYSYDIPFYEKRVRTFTMEDFISRTMELKYENCSSADDYCFFREYVISSQSAREIYLSLKLSDLELNEPKNLKFDIPSHYTWL